MIEEYKDLKEFNTFRVSVIARYFVRIKKEEEIKKIVLSEEWRSSKKHLVLGGGSNILFVNDYDGFVLKNEIKGIEIIEENDEDVVVHVGAGENWHNFVMWSVERGLWGIENLVYIPGTVGAALVQNIGAYGVEVKESVVSVGVFLIENGNSETLLVDDCNFDYRMSIFKKNPEKYIITSVNFCLRNQGKAILHYGKVKELIEEKYQRKEHITSLNIAKTIKEIRQSKLPEVKEIGTAGSFFKNPIVDDETFQKLFKKFSDIKYFDLEDSSKKISAGWILDKLGYKGFRTGHTGNCEKHALIVIHDGDGTGQEVYEHVQNIIKKVMEVFQINIEPEVNIIK